MADNPRLPDHHSDIPSSGPSGWSPNPASHSQGSGNNPPPSQQSSAPPTKTHVRNLMIGGVMTILTSTVVFIITQSLKKPEGNNFLTTKEATTAAWKSYMAYENIYVKNSLSLTKNTGGISRDSLLKEIKEESDKFLKDVGDLATGKNIDKDLIKALHRRLDNETKSFPAMEQYYKNWDRITKSNASPEEKKDAVVNEMTRYNEYTKGFFERSVNDIQLIAETLSKRYGEEFSMNDFLIVQLEPQLIKTNDSVINVLRNIELDSAGNIVKKENTVPVKEKDIIGNWDANGQLFTFDKNGKMAWVLGNGEKTTGTWKIEDNILILEGTLARLRQKGVWRFTVSNITENSLTFIAAKDNSVIYFLVRIAHG